MNREWEKEFDKKFYGYFDYADKRQGYRVLTTETLMKDFITTLLTKECEKRVREELHQMLHGDVYKNSIVTPTKTDENNNMTPEQHRAREHGREVERKLGLRKADCPECGDAIAKNGKCVYCDYVTPTKTDKTTEV